MGRKLRRGYLAAPLLLLLGLVLSSCGVEISSDNTIFGGSHTIESGDVIEDDVTVMGGTLSIEEGAVVGGDLTIMGGTVNLDGEVQGSVTTFGGTVVRGPNSSVGETTNLFGGETRPSEQGGSEETVQEPRTATAAIAAGGRSVFDRAWSAFRRIASIIISAIGLGLVGLLTAMFLPDRIRNVSQAASQAPAASIGVGCLSMPVIVIAALLLIITIIGAPALMIATFLGLILGTVGIGYALGDRLLRAADLRAPRVAAATAIGSAVLMLGYSVLTTIPVLDFFVGVGLGAWALGAVILTRAGENSYPVRALAGGAGGTAPPPPSPVPAPRPLYEEDEETLSTDELLSRLAADLEIDDEGVDESPPTTDR